MSVIGAENATGNLTKEDVPFYMMKSQPTTPIARRKTLTNNMTELRNVQQKGNQTNSVII